MARSKGQPPPRPERPEHSTLEKRHNIKLIERRIAELQAFDPAGVTDRFNDPKMKALEASIEGTLADVFGNATDDYRRYQRATRLDHGPVSTHLDGFGGRRSIVDFQRYISDAKNEALALMQQAVQRLKEEIERDEELSALDPEPSRPAAAQRALSRRVFIVHGHDGEMREAVARFLGQIGFDPIILHEQSNGGRTVIEKFEAHSEPADFAVVLLSGDDEGHVVGSDPLRSRARQNVILELGYFVGKLSRARVCALKRGELEVPSDIVGVMFETFDDAGHWRQVIARELQAAGYEIDWNAVMRR